MWADTSLKAFEEILQFTMNNIAVWEGSFGPSRWIFLLERCAAGQTAPDVKTKRILDFIRKNFLEDKKHLSKLISRTLWSSTNPRLQLEILCWIFLLEKGSEVENAFFDEWLSSSGYNLGYELVGHAEESIRLYGVQMLNSLNRRASTERWSPLKLKMSSDSTLSFEVLLRQLNGYTPNEEVLRKLTSMAFFSYKDYSAKWDSWFALELSGEFQAEYLYILLRLLSASNLDLAEFKAEVLDSLHQESHKQFWLRFDDYQDVFLSLADKDAQADWDLSMDIIANFTLKRLKDSQSGLGDVELFTVRIAQMFSDDERRACLSSTRFLETLFSVLMADLSSSTGHRVQAITIQRLIYLTTFFLYHHQDLHHILQVQESSKNIKATLQDIVNHKSFPWESCPSLCSLLLDFLSSILEIDYAAQLQLRDESVCCIVS